MEVEVEDCVVLLLVFLLEKAARSSKNMIFWVGVGAEKLR